MNVVTLPPFNVWAHDALSDVYYNPASGTTILGEDMPDELRP